MGCCFSQTQSVNANAQIPNISQQISFAPALPQENSIKANQNKNLGNEHFRKGEFQQAIVYYNLAISYYPKDINYYNNRLVCFKKLGKWQNCLQASQESLKIQNNNPKGLLYKGFSLAELSKNNVNGRKKMINEAKQIFLQISTSTIDNFKKEAQQSLKKINLLQKYYDKASEQSKQQQFKNYLQNKINITQMPIQLNAFYLNTQQLNSEISIFFANIYSTKECPQYYQDPISYEIFKDPFISPSGLSYQRELLIQHITKNGNTDPITKEIIEYNNVPFLNKNLQQLIDKGKYITKWRMQQNAIQNPKFINF